MFAQAHTHSIKDHPRQVAGIVGLAAFVGAITAMLFTPRRGSEVRHGLKRRGMMMKEKSKHLKHKHVDGNSTEKMAKPGQPSSSESSDVQADEVRRKGEP